MGGKVLYPSPASAAEINHCRQTASPGNELANDSPQRVKKEAVSPLVPEVADLHIRQDVKARGIIFFFTVVHRHPGNKDSVFLLGKEFLVGIHR